MYVVDRESQWKWLRGQRYIWQHPVRLVSGITYEPRSVTSYVRATSYSRLIMCSCPELCKQLTYDSHTFKKIVAFVCCGQARFLSNLLVFCTFLYSFFYNHCIAFSCKSLMCNFLILVFFHVCWQIKLQSWKRRIADDDSWLTTRIHLKEWWHLYAIMDTMCVVNDFALVVLFILDTKNNNITQRAITVFSMMQTPHWPESVSFCY